VEISVVLPVFNGADFIRANLEVLLAYLARTFESFEVVVVDDGSTDETASRIESIRDDRLRFLRLPRNSGKYAALAAGMAVSRADCRVFTDADLPYDLEALSFIARLVNQRGFHVVVGDRTLPESEYRVHQPWLRSAATRVFTFFVTIFVTGGLFDTQCGLKGFRADVAGALFPLLEERGFAGDVELLYVALKYNLEIRRIPVRLRRSGPSTVRLGRHAFDMLRRIGRLRRNWNRGVYSTPTLERLSSQAYFEPCSDRPEHDRDHGNKESARGV
jgi:dolichyl-phosphate beta-glucosyltransferase